MALKEGPYPVRKCPSVNQKFQAEFGVAKEQSYYQGSDFPRGSARVFTLQPHPHRHQYPTPGAFPMGGVSETRKAPSIEGASFIGSNGFGGRRGGQD